MPDDVDGRLRNAVVDRFRELQANAPNWTFNYWGMADHALDFIPEGWAKLGGKWVELKYLPTRGGYVVIEED